MKTPEAIAAIVADYSAGVPVNDMIRKHGTSAESIRTYARRAGLGPRPQVRRERGVCESCTHPRVLNADGLCDPCADEIPLINGQWVRNGLTLMWVGNPAPEPVGDDFIACPKCQATVSESCRTKRGHRTNDHVERTTPRRCACGAVPKPSSRYCGPCAREAALRVKRESDARARGVAA